MFITRHSKLIITLFLLVTVVLCSRIGHLVIVIDSDEILPQNHPFVVVTKRIEKIFGNQFSAILTITPHEGDMFQPKVIDTLIKVTRAIETAPGVVRTNVASLAAHKIKAIGGTVDGLDVHPFLDSSPSSAAEWQTLRDRIDANPVLTDLLVSRDRRTVSVIAEFHKVPGGFRVIESNLRTIVATNHDAAIDIDLAGFPIYLGMIERYSDQMGILFPLAVLLIGLLHWEAFRTGQGFLLPLVTALLAVAWAMGIMSWAGVALDAFNVTTPILILAIAAGHAVQILKRYYEEFEQLIARDTTDLRMANRQAVANTLQRVGPVMVAAGSIAAASFLSLWFFPVRTIQSFGLFTGLGILGALVIELTFIPALRSVLPPPRLKQTALPKITIWDRLIQQLDRLRDLLPTRQGVVGLLVLVAILGSGVALLQVDVSMRNYFRTNNPARLEDAAINQKLGGTNTLYVLIDGGKPDAIKDPALLRAMAEVQTFLDHEPLVGKTLSLVDYLRRIHRAAHEDQAEFDRLPATRDENAQYLLLYSLSGDPGDFDNVVDYDYRHAVIQVFLHQDNAALIHDLAARVQVIARDRLPHGVTLSVGGNVTSPAALNDVLVHAKLINIFQIAAMVFILASLLLRSPMAGLVVMLPLVMTVLVLMGGMGWLGVPLSLTTSTLAAQAMGIGADFVIYFIYRLREQASTGLSPRAAVHATMQSAGKAILFVASAVTVGYAVLILSWDYLTFYWMGSMICIAMMIASLTALTLVPALLLVWEPAFAFRPGTISSAPASRIALMVALLATLTALAMTSPAQADDAVAIMERNNMTNRLLGSTADATFTLTNNTGQERVRQTTTMTKLLPNGIDTMRFTRFLSPADVKGTTTLTIEHTDGDDDIWIYLPATHKVRRLVASNKRDSYVGTDFTYGDIIGHRVADWHHQILREETLDGTPCHVIESRAKSPEVVSHSGYARRLQWIAKDSAVAVKAEMFDPADQPFKVFLTSDIQQVDPQHNRWQAMRFEAKNLQTGHRTVIQLTKFRLAPNLSEDLFTTRAMERD
ncbi:MAG: outer membrane lipoprotein-sorting protein [Magnetococcales bacterium]|nr:outer membrane lipoprotein-sorting protein [Magnetococcales bacterium]